MADSKVRLTRRGMLKWVGIGAAGVFMAGCGGAAAPTATTAPKPAAAPTTAPAAAATTAPAAATKPAEAPKTTPAGKVIDIQWMFWSDPKAAGHDQVVEAFMKKNPNIKVEAIFVGDRYEDKIRTMLASGSPPNVFQVNDDYVKAYKVQNYIIPLTPYAQKSGFKSTDFYPNYYDFSTHDGALWYWWTGLKPRLFYYNQDLFKEAGIANLPEKWDTDSWNWDACLEYAKKLTNKDKGIYGISADDTGSELISVHNNGGDNLYDKDGKKFIMADAKAVEAVQWLADLTCKNNAQPTRGELKNQNSTQFFTAGRLGMLGFVGSQAINTIRLANVKFNWDVAAVPKKVNRKTEGSFDGYCIGKSSKEPDAGWELLAFLTGPEAAKIYCNTGFCVPAHIENSKVFVTANQGKPPKNIALFLDGANNNLAINFTENTERSRTIYRPLLDDVYNCKKSAKEVLEGCRTEVEASLAGKF